MVNDPYQVLGIGRNASPEEIKKAYRKKAKEYHPDLHPNDPVAAQKMNEVNEAYDQLQHPEKYEAQRRRENQRSSDRSGAYGRAENPEGGRGGAGGSSSGYGSGQWGYGKNGPFGGFSGDFGGFGFEQMFGFGERRVDTRPHVQAGDCQELVWAIDALNRRDYKRAEDLLGGMRSSQRNHRWYYVSAVAYEGMGNRSRAMDFIQRAMQLSPENQVYRQLYRQYQEKANWENPFSAKQQGYGGYFYRILLGLFLLPFLMRILGLLFYGLRFA